MFLTSAQTSGAHHFWRYLLTIIVVILAYFVGQIPLGVILFLSVDNLAELAAFEKDMDFSKYGIDPNLGLAIILFMFILSFLALWGMVRGVHKRPFLGFISASKKLRWGRFFYGFAVWFILAGIIDFTMYQIDPANYSMQLDWGTFIPLIFVALLLLPIQTSFEEIFVRGYLMQGIGLLGGYRFIPLLATSLIFGLGHSMNPEIAEYGYLSMMLFYIGFGLVLGILTLIDNGLELPMGIHAANNIYAAVIVSYKGSALQTASMFKTEFLDMGVSNALWFMSMLIFLFLAWKKYKWHNWQLLWGKIPFNSSSDTV